MSKKRLFSLLLFCVCFFLLVGCQKETSQDLWNRYVDAVNTKNIQEVAKTLYSTEKDITKFVSDNPNYFDEITKIETISYKLLHVADFTDKVNTQAYYLAEVTAKVNGSSEIEFNLYLRSDNYGVFLCSDLNLTDEEKEYGNQPDSLFIKKMYYTNNQYIYRFNEAGTAAWYVQNLDNAKNVVIPSEIDGLPVTTILRDSFFHTTKILSFTIPKSKLQTVEIPEGVTTIGERAFYQCKNLKQITIPSTVTLIDKLAFASCTSVKTVELLPITVSAEKTGQERTSTSTQDLIINNAKNLIVGDIITLKAVDSQGNPKTVKWSVPKGSSIGTIDIDTGEFMATGVGEITITVKEVSTGYTATVSMTIDNCVSVLTIVNDAFSRLSSLKELYIYASNPNSINITGGQTAATSKSLFVNSNVKIYIPKGTLKMYTSNATWAVYKTQFIEMD